METCKFIEDFARASGGEFPELKFCGATYYKNSTELTVKFLVSAFDYKTFMDDKQRLDKAERIVAEMFPGIKTNVQYIKTYADEAVVRNKAMEYFNATNAMLFRRLNPNNLVITVDDASIKIELRFDAAICKMLETGSQIDGLKFALERAFKQTTDIVLKEVELDVTEEEEYFASTVAKNGASLRLVEIKPGAKIYAKGKIESINQMPNYIADVKSAGENIVLCGKVSGFSRRKYKNKKFNPDDAKSGPEELPLIAFHINDSTGNIETVCFPRFDEADKIEQRMRDGDEVVCIGKVSTSAFTGMPNYAVNAIFSCKIDYDSIHAMERMPVPERYEIVRPKPFKTVGEQGFIDDGMAAVDEFMKDKAFVVFDLETTSTQIATTEIIEIGAIRIENGAATSFSTLVKPSDHIPEGATAINHITDDMVAFAPTIDKVMPDFYKFTAGATLAGHNIEGFDLPIIRRIGSEKGYYFDNDSMDTLILAKQLMPERKSFSLENIARDFGFTHTEAHRALSDVEANLMLLKELLRRKLLKQKGTK